MRDRRAVNVAEFSGKVDGFVPFPPGYKVTEISAQPQNALERLATRPKLSRLRAAWQAVRAADGGPIVSHLPRTTLAVALAQRLLRSKSRHLAFAFNFTALPTGRLAAKAWRSLDAVDRFVVFSNFERQFYAERLNIPSEKLKFTLWTQEPPTISPEPAPLPKGMYVSSVGGEGRDYETLIAAARLLPHVQFIFVTRPYNSTEALPPNVLHFTNLPGDRTWRIVADSLATVVPLLTTETCCGHITIVGSELLGVPVISTHSAATTDYTDDVALCAPGDSAALAQLIERHVTDKVMLMAQAQARLPAKIARHDRSAWQTEIANFVQDSDERRKS